MLRTYSPKRINTYFSSASLTSYIKNGSLSKNTPSQILTSTSKKSQSPYQHNLAQKYAINKTLKNSGKLTHKYDSKKKYLFNNTTYGTPFQKSLSPSYISTPNQKSFTLQSKNLSATLDFMINENSKTINNLKKIVQKDNQQFLSTQEQNLSENVVKVKFIISQNKISQQSKSKQKNHKHQNQSKGSLKVIQKNYQNYVSFNSMRQQFLKDSACVSDQIKNYFHAFSGFQTIPYSYSLTQQINNTQKCTFQWLLEKGIRQISLAPVYIQKSIDYSNIQFKDFQVLQHLGSGGFSTVYLAKNKLNGQLCALKLIQKDSITTPKKIKMLQNQRNILLNINHPNLVQLCYAFQSNSYVIFGLQYCSNGNLYNFLQKKKNLSQDQAKYVFRQILSGVSYLHDQNIIFRDIKLENILFDSFGNIKITDFGLSKPNVNDQQITYSYCGSPQYMAPQMLTKQGHSFEVDYYALGILLYELLFGRSPFYAPKKEDIFSGIMNNDVVFPKNPIVSKQVKGLIKGLLQKNPKRRIGSLKGIKQIRSHPWLRNVNQSDNQNPFIFKTTYQSQLVSPSDKKKIHQIFESQREYTNSQKHFFMNSFINDNFRKKIENKIHIFTHQQFRMKKTKKIKQIQNISMCDLEKENYGQSSIKKQKSVQRRTESKNSSSSKIKMKSKKAI